MRCGWLFRLATQRASRLRLGALPPPPPSSSRGSARRTAPRASRRARARPLRPWRAQAQVPLVPRGRGRGSSCRCGASSWPPTTTRRPPRCERRGACARGGRRRRRLALPWGTQRGAGLRKTGPAQIIATAIKGLLSGSRREQVVHPFRLRPAPSRAASPFSSSGSCARPWAVPGKRDVEEAGCCCAPSLGGARGGWANSRAVCRSGGALCTRCS